MLDRAAGKHRIVVAPNEAKRGLGKLTSVERIEVRRTSLVGGIVARNEANGGLGAIPLNGA
jgi:hypothetical protein